MNGLEFVFCGEALTLLPSGALFWQSCGVLCVSDLHLGKSERMARRGGPLLPPYEARETLMRLEADIAACAPKTVICLGDSFDDLEAARALDDETIAWIAALKAGREWVWVEGNHDAGPVEIAGTHLVQFSLRSLVFRHIAVPGEKIEISGHYHPKATINARGRRISRRCALVDEERLILPAYGTYTGGLDTRSEDLAGIMGPGARALLLADPPLAIPMPR